MYITAAAHDKLNARLNEIKIIVSLRSYIIIGTRGLLQVYCLQSRAIASLCHSKKVAMAIKVAS